MTRRCFRLLVLGAALSVQVSAGTLLPLINPGFETGDFQGWTVAYASPPVATTVLSNPGNPANLYYAGLFSGFVSTPPSYNSSAVISQSVILPTEADVRWQFWYSAYLFLDTRSGGSPCFTASLQGPGHTMAVSECITAQQGFVLTVDPALTRTPSNGFGFDVISDNLMNFFQPGETVTVRYSGVLDVGVTDAGYEANAFIDERSPVPEPSALHLAFGSLLLGVVWVQRKRLVAPSRKTGN